MKKTIILITIILAIIFGTNLMHLEVFAVGSTVIGDINLDGEVSTTDIIQLKKHMVEIITLTEQAVQNADVNLNGKVESTDLILMKQYLVNIITSFGPETTATPVPTPSPDSTAATCNHNWGNYQYISGEETHYATCTICGATIQQNCDFSGGWQTGNPDHHYKMCSKCSGLGENEPHNWENGKCKICGRIESVATSTSTQTSTPTPRPKATATPRPTVEPVPTATHTHVWEYTGVTKLDEESGTLTLYEKRCTVPGCTETTWSLGGGFF